MSTGDTTPVEPREAVERAIDRRTRREQRRRWQVAGALALAVLLLDQLTKTIIRASLDPGQDIGLVPGLEITRVRNEGIAFSLFPGRQSIIATLTVIALALIALALLRLVARNTWVAAGAGLLFGGSVGNLIDRVQHGGVTDFINVTHWPAFNVADIGIVSGAVCVVIGLLKDGEEHET